MIMTMDDILDNVNLNALISVRKSSYIFSLIARVETHRCRTMVASALLQTAASATAMFLLMVAKYTDLTMRHLVLSD